MNNERPEYLVPALIGGGVAGVLSGMPVLYCLCCLWIIAGAVLGTAILARNTSGPLTAGDGAISGALTGIVAAIVFTVLEMSPLGALNRNFVLRLAERWAQASGQSVPQLAQLRQLGAGTGRTLPALILGLFISAAIFAVLGILGGVIGVSLFGKKKPPAGPPPQGSTNATV
jgi:hypothetical protein